MSWLRLATAVVLLAGVYYVAGLAIRVIYDLAVFAVIAVAAFIAFKVGRSMRR